MAKRYYRKPWYVWAVRILLVCCLGLALWAGAIASPFLTAHILEMKGAAQQMRAAAAVAASFLIAVAFVCYLLDRV